MGCQNLCQNNIEDGKYTVSGVPGNDQISSRTKIAYSRNVNKNNQLNDHKTLTETYKCSLNIHETIVEKDMLRFTIKASNIHKMIPVWVEKNSLVSFSVAGLWSFQESTEMFSSVGCFNFEDKPNGMPFGCLAAYISNGPYFTVYDGLVLENQKEGPLYMFQNNGLYSVNPKGSLEVEIRGVKPMSIYEIEMNLGWNLALLDTSIPEMKEDEVNLLIYINKVRTNPKHFATQYLTNENKSIAEKELIKLLMTEMEPIPRLLTCKELYSISLNHAMDLGKNKLAGHESSFGMNMEQRLVDKGINTKIFAENCIFGYNDPIEIILKLLIDEDNENRNQRKIILNKDFNMVGVSIEHHSGEYCWSCIQDFIMDHEN
jgi:uncharacterized protein YkwD